MKTLLICEPEAFSPTALKVLQAHFHVELRAVDDNGLYAAFATANAIWLRLGHRLDAARLPAALCCSVVAVNTTGTDHIDVDGLRRRGVSVVSLRGETEFLNTVHATAEHTVALLLSLLRHIPAAARDVRDGHWRRDCFRGGELFGKTAGIVGVGRLGTMVARLLGAFGMRVLGFDPRPDLPVGVERVATLEELLRTSDVVTLHASYDAHTHHLLSAERLAQMKRGAVLVNTARGGLVDEGALLRALASGHLGGAALDVLSGEPHIDGGHVVVAALQHQGNLLVVPHLGGNTSESCEKTELFIAQRLVQHVTEGAP